MRVRHRRRGVDRARSARPSRPSPERAVTASGDTGRIRAEHIANAVRRYRALPRKDVAARVDALHGRQPNLLASVAVQTQFGASSHTLEFLLEVLIVCDLAVQEAGVVWPTVSEAEQERHLARLTARVTRSDSLGTAAPSSRDVREHPEPALLAWVVGSCQAWLTRTAAAHAEREADKYVLLAALTFVECIAHARASPPTS